MFDEKLKNRRIITFQIYSRFNQLKSLPCTSQSEPDISIKYAERKKLLMPPSKR